MTFCGFCGNPVDQVARARGQCPHCQAVIAPDGSMLSPGKATSPDATTVPQHSPLSLTQTLPPLARGGTIFGASGGTVATVAFFMTWLTFTSTSCNKLGPQVTQSGWDILTHPVTPFNFGVLFIPVLLAVVVSALLPFLTLVLPLRRMTLLAHWNFVVVFVGLVFFSLFWRHLLGNSLVHGVYLGFSLEVAGLSACLMGAVIFVMGTMVVRPSLALTQKAGSRMVSLLAGYPLLVLAGLFVTKIPDNTYLPTLPQLLGWSLFLSCVGTSVAGTILGRCMLKRRGSRMIRWGWLISLGELATFGYIGGIIVVAIVLSKLH